MSGSVTAGTQTARPMSDTDSESVHVATIDWARGEWADKKGKYSREHTLHFAGGAKLKASDATFMLPEGYRDRVKLNPENLFTACVSSAHMLSFLHVAFCMDIEVHSYRDRAHLVLGEETSEEGEDYWVKEVILYPKVGFAPNLIVKPAALVYIHELASKSCFVNRSLKTKVTICSE